MSKTVGELIRELRKEKGMSVPDLAKAIGKNRATIYRYENNEIEDFPYTVLVPIANALGTTPAYLLNYSDNESQTHVPTTQREHTISYIQRKSEKLSDDEVEQMKKMFDLMFGDDDKNE